jgi:transketolase
LTPVHPKQAETVASQPSQYALCGDGRLMEGISAEAASLAGHLKLSNLCWIYDNNHITIKGNTALAFSDDVATRFIGHGWNVTRAGDANDQEMLARAFRTFLSTRDRPTLIIVDSHIAYGAPHKQDTSAAHGEPLGEEEIRLTKRNYGWPEDAKFYVPRRSAGPATLAPPGAASACVPSARRPR